MSRRADDTRLSGKVGTVVRTEGEPWRTRPSESHMCGTGFRAPLRARNLGSRAGSMREPLMDCALTESPLSLGWTTYYITQNPHGRKALVDRTVEGPALGGLLRLSGLNGL